jgi:hypothetical protein
MKNKHLKVLGLGIFMISNHAISATNTASFQPNATSNVVELTLLGCLLALCIISILLGIRLRSYTYREIDSIQKNLNALKQQPRNTKQDVNMSQRTDPTILKLKNTIEEIENQIVQLRDRIEQLEEKNQSLPSISSQLDFIQKTQKNTNAEDFPIVMDKTGELTHERSAMTSDQITASVDINHIIEIMHQAIKPYLVGQSEGLFTGQQIKDELRLAYPNVSVLTLDSTLKKFINSKNYDTIRIDLNMNFEHGINSLVFVRKDTFQEINLIKLFDGLPLNGIVTCMQSPALLKIDAGQIGQIIEISDQIVHRKGSVKSSQ